MTDTTWGDLRATRAARPGFAAAKGVRANVYGAALEQAEQLFKAAEHVGPATSPLLLFYGTAQLGRAIVAASPAVLNAEARVQRHGASPRGIDVTPLKLSNMSVESSNSSGSSLESLARVLGACAIEQPRRLDDLIARVPVGQMFLKSPDLPDDHLEPLLIDDPAGRPGEIPWLVEGPQPMRVVVSPVPRSAAPRGVGAPLDEPAQPVEAAVPAGAADSDAPPSAASPAPPAPTASTGPTPRESLTAMFDRYPGLAGWGFNMNTAATVPVVGNRGPGFAVALEVPLREGERNLAMPSRIAERFNGAFIAYPCLDGCGRPDHPLVMWWAILLVLSSLARYHPDTWMKLTHIDRHEDASSIEQLLLAATVEVPQLALDVLKGERMRVDDE